MPLPRERDEPVAAAEEPPVLIQGALRLALWVVAAGVVAGWLILATRHVNDDYRVTHNTGVWIATSVAARDGLLYPPIFDGEHYAGTRYMPLPILLTALASAVAGDPLLGGKLLAGILMTTLLALVVYVLRRVTCPWSVAVALAAVVIGTDTGLQAGTSIGGDLLPVVLQVGARAVLMTPGPPALMMIVAGALAGLGIASKLTGLWAFLAITTWLVLQRRWRSGTTFAVSCLVTASAILGAVQLLTSGGLTAHLAAFSVAGVHSAASLLRGPNQVLYHLLESASGTVVLFPLAVLGALLVRHWRDLPVIHVALGYALMFLVVVYADVGTGPNQLLDLIVLTTLAVGFFAGRAGASSGHARPVIVWTVIVAVLWAAGIGLVRTVGFDLRRARGSFPRAANVMASRIGPSEQVLAEDPSVYVALGRRPVVMDPFMVMRLENSHPEQVNPLISWIDEKRFDVVVLVVSLDDKGAAYWWTDFHFGARVTDALRKSYRPDGMVGRYFVYRRSP